MSHFPLSVTVLSCLSLAACGAAVEDDTSAEVEALQPQAGEWTIDHCCRRLDRR
jgi:hypothetical protein